LSEKKFTVVTGNIDDAISGNYNVNIKEVLDEGWELTRNSKLPLLQALVLIFLIALFLVTVVTELMGADFSPMENPQDNLILNLVVTAVVSPLVAGMMMMGVKNAVGLDCKVTDVFGYLSRSALIALASLIISSLSNLGLALFVVPGIYLMVAMSFTYLLMIDKKLMPFQAILISIKAVTRQWFSFFAIYAFFLLLLGMSIMTFGLALIWVAPFFYNTKGVLYRRVFGVDSFDTNRATKSPSPDNDNQRQSFGA
jgi:uncharacterized membrane protein